MYSSTKKYVLTLLGIFTVIVIIWGFAIADVLADKEVAQQRTRRSRKKQSKLDADMTAAILSQLRAHLLGEEVKMAVVTPVKETVSAGKALLNMGQKLSSWVASLVKS